MGDVQEAGGHRTLVASAVELIRDKYVFPDMGAAVADAIATRLGAGDYDDLPDDEALADKLTRDLYELTADHHLRVRVRQPQLRGTEAEVIAAWEEEERLSNYHIAAVRRLEGNVGYLDLRRISGPGIAGAAIAAAMRLVAHTDALLFDLRHNTGGEPDGVQMWNSYLFPDSETHLNDIYDRLTDSTRQFWTLPYVPGPRYLDRPVWVLTGPMTFSGAEEFAYNLKPRKRATLVGTVTRGGAPTAGLPLSATLALAVPYARSINPVTGTNWEAVGVEPDVAVPAEQAFDHAYRLALEHVLRTTTSSIVRTQAEEALAGSSHGGAS
jgi:C-terminal processing protease CtpA/Prc